MNKVNIVAEVASAHNGDINKLIKLIKIAKKANCDFIQFQFYNSDEISIRGTEDYKINKKLEINSKYYPKIFNVCKKLKFPFWAMVSDIFTAKKINMYKPSMWRIHSSDIDNEELIKYFIKTKIPMSLNTGGSTINEISDCIKYVKKNRGKIKLLCHGFQGYPTPIDEANINYIKTLYEKFKINVSYQDHTSPELKLVNDFSNIAIALGAKVIEKHIIIKRNKNNADFHSSFEPNELIKFVKQIRIYERALGAKNKNFSVKEKIYRETFKKKYVYKHDLKKQ